jgi:hypothetical protein
MAISFLVGFGTQTNSVQTSSAILFRLTRIALYRGVTEPQVLLDRKGRA